ncbi:MAG: selenide, water dikinase SelD [Eubacteriales bacterium]|nr:selenide, water dikinase SelD [Eubacteriales bacterium]
MSNEIKLTKLADCAGCSAKVGAGLLAKLLKDIKVVEDPNLIVGFDKSDDASVYKINEEIAIVQTVDFFPPIVDDPFLYGAIAATNAISDIYAMGAKPKTALNVMCIPQDLPQEVVHNILRGGYEKAYEAGVIISGGHTIISEEPKYGLAVTGFVNPNKILKNCSSKDGDVIILTKPLGIGIITTASKVDLVEQNVLEKIYKQMATLNKISYEIMLKYDVHSCTDVTGFSLLGHSLEMAQGSNLTMHIDSKKVLFHKEAYDLAKMGLIPAGAYRNREYAEKHCKFSPNIDIPTTDILFDPETSGGLLISVSEKDSKKLFDELNSNMDGVSIIGYMSNKKDSFIEVE